MNVSGLGYASIAQPASAAAARPATTEEAVESPAERVREAAGQATNGGPSGLSTWQGTQVNTLA